MASTQQNGGASVIAFSWINATPTPTNEESFNGQRYNNKYVSVLTGVLSYSIHMQLFSQNQCLLSKPIIIKKVT